MKKTNKHKYYFHHTYAFKLFCTYSAIMLVALISITLIITMETSNIMIEQELKLNTVVVTKTAEYMDEKILAARKTIQDIYYSDREMQEIINQILNHNFNEIELAEYIAKKDRFDKLFFSALYNDKDIVDIILLSKNQESSYIFSKRWSSVIQEETTLKYSWIDEVMKKQDALTIIPTYDVEHSRYNPTIKIYSAITSIYRTGSTSGPIGAIIINFNAEMIKSAYDLYANEVKGNIYVLQENGGILFDSTGKNYGNNFMDMEKIRKSNSNYDISEDEIVSTKKSSNMRLIVVSILPKDLLLENINSLRYKVYGILTATILIMLLIFYSVSNLLSRRIQAIQSAMGEVQKGNLQVRVPIEKSKDELGIIGKQFNNMCSQLDDYIKRNYLSEIKLRETELMALQSQINPHFIYNTLEIIRVKAIMNKNHDVASMILLLSNLFRRSFREKEMIISLKDEVDYCKDYLELNRVRYRERMKIVYDLSENTLNKGVLKFILQPLIENIIVHSIDDNIKFVNIVIKSFIKDNDIIIEVRDSGKGISATKLKEIIKDLDNKQDENKHNHIGLKNVNERLKLAFGDKYGLEISSLEDSFTSVVAKFPIMTVSGMRKFLKSTIEKNQNE